MYNATTNRSCRKRNSQKCNWLTSIFNQEEYVQPACVYESYGCHRLIEQWDSEGHNRTLPSKYWNSLFKSIVVTKCSDTHSRKPLKILIATNETLTHCSKLELGVNELPLQRRQQWQVHLCYPPMNRKPHCEPNIHKPVHNRMNNTIPTDRGSDPRSQRATPFVHPSISLVRLPPYRIIKFTSNINYTFKSNLSQQNRPRTLCFIPHRATIGFRPELDAGFACAQPDLVCAYKFRSGDDFFFTLSRKHTYLPIPIVAKARHIDFTLATPPSRRTLMERPCTFIWKIDYAFERAAATKNVGTTRQSQAKSDSSSILWWFSDVGISAFIAAPVFGGGRHQNAAPKRFKFRKYNVLISASEVLQGSLLAGFLGCKSSLNVSVLITYVVLWVLTLGKNW